MSIVTLLIKIEYKAASVDYQKDSFGSGIYPCQKGRACGLVYSVSRWSLVYCLYMPVGLAMGSTSQVCRLSAYLLTCRHLLGYVLFYAFEET